MSYETGEVRVGSVHSVDKSTSGRRLLLTGVSSLRGRTAARLQSIKARILLLLIVPLIALIALWGFAVSVTLGDSLRVLRSNSYQTEVALPTDTLVLALQNERRMSLALLGNDATQGTESLDAQRRATGQAIAAFKTALASSDLQGATTPDTRLRMAGLVTKLDGLAVLQWAVSNGKIDQAHAFAQYNKLIDTAEAIYDPSYPGTAQLTVEATAILELDQACELVSREDALLTGALADRKYTVDDHEQFVQLVAQHRLLLVIGPRGLPSEDQFGFERLIMSPEYGRFQGLEEQLIQTPGSTTRTPPVDIGSWHTASESVVSQLDALEEQALAGTIQRAHDQAFSVILRLVLAGGLGLLAVIASIVIAFLVGRRLIRESRTMASTVHTFTRERLPLITELAKQGEQPDDEDEIAELDFHVSEIRKISVAFTAARDAVVTATMSEAAARRGLSDVFVNLARRSQALLHRQLTLLDGMERRADQKGELENLFQLDHLATRMRRHAEGLVILSGRAAGRTWRSPVAVIDVVRGAGSEVEDYTRVRVLPMPKASLLGAAVADTIHLLAELIENATMFSPPESPVQVTGDVVAKGFVIEIEDRGLGMTPAALAEINKRLAHSPDFDLTDSARLGLFVVARLARRHEITVTLRTSPYGGTTAIVLLPAALIVDPDEIVGSVDEPARSAIHPVAAQPPVADANGLPRRQRQANLVLQLRDGAPGPGTDGGAEHRPPEDTRNMMSAMQQGWRQGRAAAAQTPADHDG